MLWALGIAAAAALWWWWSLWRYPLKPCPACGAKGRIFFRFLGAHRTCGRCGGDKEVRRIGAGKGK